MKSTIEKQVKFLLIYAAFITLFFGAFIVYFFINKERNNLNELTVKRINVIDSNGRLKLVLSNSEMQHPGRMNGKDLSARKRPAGLIFFNEEGDECGGLVYDGATKKGVMNSGMSFTMDQYHQDQVVQLLNEEAMNKGSYTAKRGLAINDYPPGSNMMADYDRYTAIKKIKTDSDRKLKMSEFFTKYGGRKRVFVGRNNDNSAGLFLYDKNGNVKLKIYVDSLGKPRFEMLDNNGHARDIM